MNGLAAELTWLGPVPALAPLWPLALLVALAVPAWRGGVLRLMPWAALPALLIAIAAPPATLRLPGLLLGGSLQLDGTGRWLLAAVALLWLAGGWLAVGWLRAPRRAVAFLLALSGALWLPLAGDLPSVLAASVLAAYALYGLLGGGRGGRVLLASVVVADLLILEAVLLLVQTGAGLDFESLRTALVALESRDILLALLLLGFGTKAGLMGLHYWLAPAMEDAPARVLAPTTAFTLVAGLLPLLRLLSGSGASWPSAGTLLPWLALAGGLWAVMAGLLQAARTHRAYALSALASLWLGLLGRSLTMPAPMSIDASMGVLPPAIALSGLGMAALLLAGGLSDRGRRYEAQALAMLSALLTLLAVLAAVLLTAADGDAMPWPLVGAIACVGILLGASARLPRDDLWRKAPACEQRAAAALVAGGLCLTVVALPSSFDALSAVNAWSGDHLVSPMAALFGGFAVGLVAVAALARLPRIPAGDLLVPIERAIAGLIVAVHGLGTRLAAWRDGFQMAIARRSRDIARQRAIDAAERRLRRWSTATILLLIAGAAVALLVRPG